MNNLFEEIYRESKKDVIAELNDFFNSMNLPLHAHNQRTGIDIIEAAKLRIDYDKKNKALSFRPNKVLRDNDLIKEIAEKEFGKTTDVTKYLACRIVDVELEEVVDIIKSVLNQYPEVMIL